jgi:hypothetical protein
MYQNFHLPLLNMLLSCKGNPRLLENRNMWLAASVGKRGETDIKAVVA